MVCKYFLGSLAYQMLNISHFHKTHTAWWYYWCAALNLMMKGVDMTMDDKVSKQIEQWKRILQQLNKPTCNTETILERYANGRYFTQYNKWYVEKGCKCGFHDYTFKLFEHDELNYVDMFNMFPFANTICSFEMSGKELVRMISDFAGNENVYSVTGLRKQISLLKLLKIMESRL